MSRLKRVLVWCLGYVFAWSPRSAVWLARRITRCWPRFPHL